MKSAKLAFGALLVAVIALPAVGDDDQDQKSYWMKKKLEFSEHILKGLALADFDTIIKSADSMRNMSVLEKLTRRTHAEEYRAQLAIFQASTKQLIHEAEKKNIDGTALAFTQMTLSCVNCHKVLRDPVK